MRSFGGPDSPASGGALTGAADWVGSLLTGSLALAIATLAIAAIGFMMLRGRAPVGRAGRIILGCFVLFSAPVIASGLVGLQRDRQLDGPADASVAQLPAYQPTIAGMEEKDPFAGAAAPPPEQEVFE